MPLPLHRLCFLIHGVLSTMLLSSAVQAQQIPVVQEYAAKAALLYKLPHFTYPVTNEDANTFSFCILGANPFGGALEQLARTPFDRRTVQVLKFSTVGELEKCNLVFIARSETEKLPVILKKLSETSAIVVSDIEDFAQTGGMMELALGKKNANASLEILINRRIAEASGVKFKASLLKLAKIIDP